MTAFCASSPFRRQTHCWVVPFLFAASIASIPTVSLAQDAPPERIALTQPPENDPEFNLMGEFAGSISTGENQTEQLGIQIRPLGNDQFEALQYKGGLPGFDTFSDEPPLELVGRRSDDLVVLSGGPWAIFVDSASCLIIDRTGQRVGELKRVHRGSPTMGARPPKGATVLFDGTNVDQFTSARMTEEGLLMEGANTLPMFQDFDLHVEFRLPYMPTSDGQQRGNSGCYLQSRYEVQVLDSFAQKPVFNGCSSIYRFKAPDLNMCYPPLQWQTYDIHFTAPRWGADGTKLRDATITVWQNGVKTQDNVSLKNKTGAGKPEEPTLLPIKFQDHTDPVRFRNIWIVDRGLVHTEFPVMAPTEEELAAERAAKQAEAAKKAAESEKAAAAKAAAEKPAAEKSDTATAKPDAAQPKDAKKEETKAEPAADNTQSDKTESKPAKQNAGEPAKTESANATGANNEATSNEATSA